MKKQFYKYHGAGNDFIIINNMDGEIVFSGEEARQLCDRHFGIGGDGLILLEPSDKADCFMNYYNSDGSVAEMCGNGVRCTAKFFLEQTQSKGNQTKELLIDTRAGIKKIICNDDGTFSVNMGAPVFSHADFPNSPLTLENILFNFVSMGNPHAVSFVKDVSLVDVPRIGPIVENDPHFPNKLNVEFVEKVKDDYFKVKVWERGCGITMACGTGACAVYATLRKEKLIDENIKEVALEFPGGKLYLSQNEEGQIILRGPAMYVFKGEIE